MRCYLKTECLSTLTFIEYIMRLLCHSNGVYISFHKTFGIVMLLCFQHLLSNTHGCCVDAQSPNSFFLFCFFPGFVFAFLSAMKCTSEYFKSKNYRLYKV